MANWFPLVLLPVVLSACNDSVTRPDAVTHRAGEAQLVALAEGDGRVVAVGTRYWYHTDDDGSTYAPDSDSAVV
ncbi:MAG: hypothetical protein ACRENP_26400, partial [Longimicrobiales bacterium]